MYAIHYYLVVVLHHNYEDDIYLYDDGNRPNIKDLADRMGINYITRFNNKNSKAGNYNNALKHIDGKIRANPPKNQHKEGDHKNQSRNK